MVAEILKIEPGVESSIAFQSSSHHVMWHRIVNTASLRARKACGRCDPIDTRNFMNEVGGHLTTTNPSTTTNGVLAASADNDIKSNLIRVKIARHAIITDCPVNFATLTIRSINNKIDDFSTLMTDQNLHVWALTETWHEDSECVPIKRLRCMGLNILIEVARSI